MQKKEAWSSSIILKGEVGTKLERWGSLSAISSHCIPFSLHTILIWTKSAKQIYTFGIKYWNGWCATISSHRVPFAVLTFTFSHIDIFHVQQYWWNRFAKRRYTFGTQDGDGNRDINSIGEARLPTYPLISFYSPCSLLLSSMLMEKISKTMGIKYLPGSLLLQLMSNVERRELF